MTTPGAGLGAFLKKQAQDAEAALQKGTPKLGDGAKEIKEKTKEKEKDKDADANSAKQKLNAFGAKPAKQHTAKPEQLAENETMDSSVARIVNFSDSDDDEPLKPRPAPELPPRRPPMKPDEKNAMLGKKVFDGVSGMGQWIKGQTQPAELNSGQRGIRRIQRAWSNHGAERLQQAKSSVTVDFLVKVIALWLLKKYRPQFHRVVELCCLAVPISDAIFSWQQQLRPQISGRLGKGLHQTAEVASQFAAPAAVADIGEWLRRKVSNRSGGGSSNSSSSNNETGTDTGNASPERPSVPEVTMRPIRVRPPRVGPSRLRREGSVDSNGSSRRLRREGGGSPGGFGRTRREGSGDRSSALDRHIDAISEPRRMKIRKSRSAGTTPRERSPRVRPSTPTVLE